MFKIQIIASSSKGNAYAIHDDDKSILIDPGIGISEIRKALNFGVSRLDMCLLSHEHKDHSKAIKDIAKMRIECFASNGTWETVYSDDKFPPCATNINSLDYNEPTEFNDWTILGFETEHDAAEPLGFLIRSPSGKKILYATDTQYIRYKFTGVTHYMVECNYSEALLAKNERLRPNVKSRIRQSHFELEQVKKFFGEQDLSKTDQIYLIHLSDDNSDEKLFVKEIEKITGKPVYA
ncbi:MAG: MBL fold metallo-hydrolase [Desulfatitalea sp.]|nr:MBL fold metallo-hydrolase [Desulfatitalea sp.]